MGNIMDYLSSLRELEAKAEGSSQDKESFVKAEQEESEVKIEDFQLPAQKFDWRREWEEEGKFIWRQKGEITIESQRLGGQMIKLLAGREKYDPDCPLPQFALPDDWEIIEAIDKTLKVFPGSRIVSLISLNGKEVN